jgi:hypothetical protein
MRSFECRNDDVLNCECVSIPLSAETLSFLRNNYDDCLCSHCLQEIEKAFIEEGIKKSYNKI